MVRDIKNEYTDKNEKIDFKYLLKYQEEFLKDKYIILDNLIYENKRLNSEISKLNCIIESNRIFTKYLINSYWWKLTYPFRKIKRIIHKNYKGSYLISEETIDDKNNIIMDSVAVIIEVYKKSSELVYQIEKIKNQKGLAKIIIIIIDKEGNSLTEEICKKYDDVYYINTSSNYLYNDLQYKNLNYLLKKFNCKYTIMMNQDKIIDYEYWMYKSIFPIKNNSSLATIVLDGDINFFEKNCNYFDLRERLSKIDEENVFFIPKDRNLINYIFPELFDISSIIVKETNSSIFY